MIDIKGKKFGLLTAIEPKGKAKDGSIIWLVLCECGSDALEVSGVELRRGRKKSCGCLRVNRYLHVKREDLIGKTFGKLLVVGYRYSTENKPFLWECLCECGEPTTVRTSDLKSGSVSSCGCLKSPSLVGQRFGKLVVFEKTTEKRYGYYLWKVRCDCGNYDVATSHHLKGGSKKSCSCLANAIEDITGLKHNQLTVIELADFRSSNNELLWLCLCECGEYTHTTRDKLLSDHTKSCGCLKDLSLEKHPNWQGGLSRVTKYLRRNLKEWKQKSLELNDFRCFISNNRGRLVVHHNNPDKPFYKILKETLEMTGIEPQRSIEHFTAEQLEQLKNVCSALHFKYGLGVPLTEELHAEFHITYGYTNWTNEDFESFVREKRMELGTMFRTECPKHQ